MPDGGVTASDDRSSWPVRIVGQSETYGWLDSAADSGERITFTDKSEYRDFATMHGTVHREVIRKRICLCREEEGISVDLDHDMMGTPPALLVEFAQAEALFDFPIFEPV